MFKIVEARTAGLNIRQFIVEAPRIARKQRPGQFVILRLHDRGERIPLTIKSADPAAGTITIAVQAVGKTTSLLNSLEAGDSILDVVGPLGRPSEIRNYGTAVILAGSVGTAMALPTANALREAGNHVIFIEGARSKEMVVFEDEVRAASHEAFILTDDGSYGEQGLVTKKLDELIAAGRKLDFVLAVGPVPMMRAVAGITAPLGIKTMVSLNSIMVDGTGMCGGCRVLAGDKSKFACVDGPEFDAADINFDVLIQRNNMYRGDEKRSLDRFVANPEEDLKLMHDLRSRADAGRCQLETLEAAAKREVSDAIA
ncbi:MAG: sulfide/dihydroorotate dehydrogenase-like FAD/NAD-binding protein [Terracidiphilus sp.]